MTRLLAKLGLTLVGCLLLAPPAHATFPGQNGKIVFTVSLGDSYSEFDLMNPDGRGKTRLTDLQGQNTSPAWSPDGTRVAFTTDHFARNTRRDIAVMNADGTGLTQLATNASDPAWSPDGTKIAFRGDVARPFSPANIYAINADGTGLTRLTNTEYPVFDGHPAWSPDGTKIAFTRTIPIPGRPPRSDENIWVMNADGTDVTRLTSVPYGSCCDIATDPNWSPDGTKIAFGTGFLGRDVAVMNADGSAVTKLYAGSAPESSEPVWSPDGSRIAFRHALLGTWYIFTMNPDGSGQTFLGGPYSSDFDWQPLPSEFKNRAKKCKTDGKRGRQFGACALPTISEFPVFGVGDITAGPDGAVWFTSGGGGEVPGSISRITTSGTLSQFPLPASFTASRITAGPDGALWFTSEGGEVGSIGRITTSGTITQFTIPTSTQNPRIEPYDITAGADGALWFTELNGNRIGRVTTDGTFREFVVPSSQYAEIVAGPDGALWFTEGVANKIGRMTTSGTISEFPTPTHPYGITVGPDGALWFIASQSEDDYSIGRMTTSGDFSAFSLPNEHDPVADIAAGPDGALWFTVPREAGYPHASKIGRITTLGVVSELTLPEPLGAGSIAAGPDDAVWFGENGAIVRITTNPQRGDFKNASEFCDTLRTFMGASTFGARYRTFGQCVRQNRSR